MNNTLIAALDEQERLLPTVPMHGCAGTARRLRRAAPPRYGRTASREIAGVISLCFDPGMTSATDGGSDRHQASTSIDIEASPERVWRALTEPNLVSRYMHGTELRTDWTEGGPITWSGEWQGKPYEDKGRVMRFEPHGWYRWTHWSLLTGDPDTPENYHHVTYELSLMRLGRNPVDARPRQQSEQRGRRSHDRERLASECWNLSRASLKTPRIDEGRVPWSGTDPWRFRRLRR